MPPKVKITKEMIENASFEVIRERGHENLSARTIAEYLKCSTQPVLYSFRTVDEIREAAYGIADRYHTEFIMPKETDEIPILALGLNYVRFGQEEKNLFRFLMCGSVRKKRICSVSFSRRISSAERMWQPSCLIPSFPGLWKSWQEALR